MSFDGALHDIAVIKLKNVSGWDPAAPAGLFLLGHGPAGPWACCASGSLLPRPAASIQLLLPGAFSSHTHLVCPPLPLLSRPPRLSSPAPALLPCRLCRE